jgi:hypothetical protein
MLQEYRAALGLPPWDFSRPRTKKTRRNPAAIMALFAVMLTGCAGMVFSHKTYTIKNPGTVTQATPRTVLTTWPKDRWYYTSDSLAVGDRVDHVCPETVPALHTQFQEVTVSWDKARKCWMWYSQ